MRIATILAAAAGLALTAPSSVAAQQAKPLAVGQAAPDFSIPGATRYGILRDPIRLSDFRGKTVVLAFFIQARTPG
jgi:peroxiredoxin Q/BCP